MFLYKTKPQRYVGQRNVHKCRTQPDEFPAKDNGCDGFGWEREVDLEDQGHTEESDETSEIKRGSAGCALQKLKNAKPCTSSCFSSYSMLVWDLQISPSVLWGVT